MSKTEVCANEQALTQKMRWQFLIRNRSRHQQLETGYWA